MRMRKKKNCDVRLEKSGSLWMREPELLKDHKRFRQGSIELTNIDMIAELYGVMRLNASMLASFKVMKTINQMSPLALCKLCSASNPSGYLLRSFSMFVSMQSSKLMPCAVKNSATNQSKSPVSLIKCSLSGFPCP